MMAVVNKDIGADESAGGIHDTNRNDYDGSVDAQDFIRRILRVNGRTQPQKKSKEGRNFLHGLKPHA